MPMAESLVLFQDSLVATSSWMMGRESLRISGCIGSFNGRKDRATQKQGSQYYQSYKSYLGISVSMLSVPKSRTIANLVGHILQKANPAAYN
jgi:hypothetical protein